MSISIKDFGIWARLGNQMFQYAYLRSLSIDKGFKIKLPIGRAQLFDIIVDENTLLYDEKFKSENIPPGGNILFNGYFLSEKYFINHKEIIKSDFTFKENIHRVGQDFINNLNIQGKTLVALHVRRTDNLSSNSPTVLVTDTFRTNAINYLINNKIENIFLLIFSDDKQWCKDNLKYPGVPQIIVENLTDIEEMYVMSLCDHFIIGSSSYSWWAAWLSFNKNKIIIVPNKWLSDNLANQEKDLIPSNWIVLNM